MRYRPPRAARMAQKEADGLAQLILKGDLATARHEAERIEAERQRREQLARTFCANRGVPYGSR